MGNLLLGMWTDRNGDVFACDYSSGVLRTTDGGNSWTYQNDGLPEKTKPVGFTNLNDGGFLMGTYPPGIFKSTDRGDTWIPCPGVTNMFGRIGSVRELPNGDILVGSVDSGMFRSANKGISWSKISSFPASSSPVWDIKILHTGRILAATQEGGVFKSDDNGYKWEPLIKTYHNCFQSIGMTGADTVYACSTIYGLYRSTNNGDSWVNLGPYNQGVRSMICDKNGDVYMFAGAQGALVRRAGSNNWEMMNIPALVAISMKSSGKKVYVSSLSGFSCSSDGGESWTHAELNKVFDILVKGQNELFAATYGGRVWKSTDNGKNWTQVLPATVGQPDAFSISMDSSGNMFAGIGSGYWDGYNGIFFKSTDNGATWKESGKGLGGGSVLSIIVTDKNTVLAADNYHGMYRSTDGGVNWNLSSSGLPASDNFASESMVKDKEGRIFCGTILNGVYVSTDDGLNWRSSSTGFTNKRILNLRVLDDGKLFALTSTGIIFSSDHGENWRYITDGFPKSIINAFAIDSDGILYVGTNGNGIYKSAKSFTEVMSRKTLLPETYQIKNYPNPFNPVTTIEYSVPDAGFVRIAVFNSLGEKVTELVSKELPSGQYKAYWNAEGFASGIYFCRMESKGFMQTIKLLYLK